MISRHLPALWSSALLGLATTGAAAAQDTFYAKRIAPVLDQNCVVCHGEKKHKAGLRLDTFEALMKGSDGGTVVEAGKLKESELFRRITLPHDNDEFMPSEGKPPLKPDEIKVIELWILAGASDRTPLDAIQGAPALAAPKAPPPPLAPDWHPRAAVIANLEKTLGVRLVPQSQIPTDGLVLRTASAPSRCDDAALARLAPVADLIVRAELARTKVTDAGLASLAPCVNLRSVDLSGTKVTSAGVTPLAALPKLESVNLTGTKVDDRAVKALRANPGIKNIWVFGTAADSEQ